MTTLIKSPHICDFVKAYLPEKAVIVEAGAFMGHDTLRLAHHWPLGTIHAFEPIPELFEKLTDRTATEKNIHCYQYALSNHTASATMYVAQKPQKPGITTQASSLHKPQDRLNVSPIVYPHRITVDTITLDQWATIHTIAHVDFLWLDMQGHELSALKGALHMLQNVRAIYTEVNFIQAYEGQPMAEEVIAWLNQQRFKEIGRTFENTTDWFFGEILFIKDDTPL